MSKCLFFGIATGRRLLFCFRVVSLWFMVGERHLYNEFGTRRTVVIAVFADIPDSLLYCYSYALPVREKSEFLFQIFSCDALFTFGHLLRCSAAYEVSSAVSTFRTKVDDVVGTFYQIHVVFYHNQTMAFFNERIESLEQFFYVVEVQTGGRLVEDEQRRVLSFLSDEVSKFHTLVLTSGKC